MGIFSFLFSLIPKNVVENICPILLFITARLMEKGIIHAWQY